MLPKLRLDIEARILSEDLIFFFKKKKELKKKDSGISEFKAHICFIYSVGLAKTLFKFK